MRFRKYTCGELARYVHLCRGRFYERRGILKSMKGLFRQFGVSGVEDDLAPHALQRAAAGGILLLVLLTFALVNIQSIVLLTSQWMSSAILPSVLIDLTNDNRVADSLGTLRRSATLDEAAQLKAADMAKYEYFAHDSPLGVTPWYWFGRVGYDYTYAGENLAVHFSDSDDVVKAWMNSPGHRANIMNGSYTEIGIGTAKGEYKGSPTIFVVQLFGRPMTTDEKKRVALAEVPASATVPLPAPLSDVAGASESAGGVQENITVPPEESAHVALDDSERTAEIPEAVPDVSSGRITEAYSVPSAVTPVDLTPPTHSPDVPSEFLALSPIATISPAIARGVLAIPIGQNGGNTAQVRESHILGQFAVRPHMVMTIVYILLALLTLCALGVSIAIEWRRHHPVQVAYGFGLIAVMWVAFYVHTVLLSGVLIV